MVSDLQTDISDGQQKIYVAIFFFKKKLLNMQNYQSSNSFFFRFGPLIKTILGLFDGHYDPLSPNSSIFTDIPV